MSTAPARVPDPRTAPPRPGLTGSQVAMVVIGSILALIGMLVLPGGAAVAVAAAARDGDGYLTTGPAPVSSRSYAVAVPGLGIDVSGPDEAYARRLLGSVRIRATAADPAKPLFVGIAPTRAVDAYLEGVQHDDVTDIDVDPVRVRYAPHAGGAPTAAPAEQTFWDRSDTGTGTRTLNWTLGTGDWTVVVMNADGSPGVAADLDLGGTLPVLRWATVVLLVLGGLLLAGGLTLIALPLVLRRRAG